MKPIHFLFLFVVIVAGATVANLLALKIAADKISAQLSGSASSSPLLGLLGSFTKKP